MIYPQNLSKRHFQDKFRDKKYVSSNCWDKLMFSGKVLSVLRYLFAHLPFLSDTAGMRSGVGQSHVKIS